MTTTTTDTRSRSRAGFGRCKRLLAIVFAVALPVSTAATITGSLAFDEGVHEPSNRFPIPRSLVVEHHELHARLASAIAGGGTTGTAAKAVAELLHPHFLKEEQIALPPLALLGPLSRGEVTGDMRDVLALTDRLRDELPRMLEEHRAVVAALERLTAAAREEQRPAVAEFAEALKVHAETEETVLYPSAVLVGAYVEAKLGR